MPDADISDLATSGSKLDFNHLDLAILAGSKPDPYRLLPTTGEKQESPADARVTRDSAIIPRWPSAAILILSNRK